MVHYTVHYMGSNGFMQALKIPDPDPDPNLDPNPDLDPNQALMITPLWGT